MEGIISFLIGYVILLVCWLIINVFFYALTVLTKKGFFFIPFAINTLLNWAIQIYFFVYPFYFLYQIVAANWGTWWLVILSFVIGLLLIGFLLSFWQMVMSLFIYPIAMITTYFSEKAAQVIDKKETDVDYEVISPKGDVVEKFQSWDKTQKNLAKWFVFSYVIAFANQFVKGGYGSFGVAWYLIIPMLVMLIPVIVISFFLGIYYLIRKRHFLGGNRYLFLTKAFKIYAIVYGISLALELLLKLIYG
ncbi:MAG TPA: hypothetical protein VF185_04760 [Patescibacteria group bacterium]